METLLKDIGFERIKYPDGQISVKILCGHIYEGLVKERINSYEDLIYVKSIAEALSFFPGSPLPPLFIPCLFGQRSDRRFANNHSFDLKVITDIINSCNFSRVQILDPHSDVCLGLINNSEKVSSFEYVEQAVKDIRTNRSDWPQEDNLVLISPDAGAYKKVFEYGEKLNLEVVGANKHRSTEGEITTVITYPVQGKDCLIVDDLCDGGRTFVQLAKRLKELEANKVYLYITHGLFSNGFWQMYEVIDHIYCTNSIKDVYSGFSESRNHEGELQTIMVKDYITQFKVI